MRLLPTTSPFASRAEGASSAMASSVAAFSSVVPPGANACAHAPDKSVFRRREKAGQG